MLTAILVAAAPLPAAEIAPPLDTPIRQEQVEIRDDGRAKRVFRLQRSIRFSAEPAGFQALVTTISADAEAGPEERDNYRIANRGLIGRTITMHLDRSGAVRSIDDIDTVWSAWTQGLATTHGGANSAAANALLQRITAMPTEQRVVLIGAMITGMVAAPQERLAAPERPITLSSPPPFSTMQLNGTASATVVGARVVTRTTATGVTPNGDARISLTSVRTADPATGFVTGATRRTNTSTRTGNLIVETTQTLTW